MREGFYYISNKKSRRERYVIRDDVVDAKVPPYANARLHTDSSPTEMQSISVPVSPLCAKNGSLNRFLYAQTLTGSTPFDTIILYI